VRRLAVRGTELVHFIEQIVDIFLHRRNRLSEIPLQHPLLEPFLIARATIKYHGMIGVDTGTEGSEKPCRQAGPVVDRAQAKRAGVIDHQPRAVVRNSHQLGHAMLKEGHLPVRQDAQQ